MKKEFEVKGPFKVETSPQPRGGLTIEKEAVEAFWKNSELEELKQRFGIYVFAIKTSACYKPYYIGKTTKGYCKEIFTPPKLGKYRKAINEVKKGQPYMFFLIHPATKPPKDTEPIDELEIYLIQKGSKKNKTIYNVQNIEQGWSIKGLIRSETKQRSAAARLFKDMFDLK